MAVLGSEWIFVSYRRKDAGGHAKNLADRLKAKFGADAVFLDTEAIKPGAAFPSRLQNAVDAAWVVVAAVGPDWLRDINKRARKLDDEDFVRLELERALLPRADGSARLVLPVLLGGAKPITAKSLTAALRPAIGALAVLNAVVLDGATWDDGFKRLLDEIEPIRQARAGGAGDYAAMAAATAAALRKLLSLKNLEPLAERWTPPGQGGVFAEPASTSAGRRRGRAACSPSRRARCCWISAAR